jgi:hypothetical protein
LIPIFCALTNDAAVRKKMSNDFFAAVALGEHIDVLWPM